MESAIEFEIVLLTQKVLNGQGPAYLSCSILPHYNTVPPGCSVICGSQSLQMWNHLPVSVREADTLSTFKGMFKVIVQACTYVYIHVSVSAFT